MSILMIMTTLTRFSYPPAVESLKLAVKRPSMIPPELSSSFSVLIVDVLLGISNTSTGVSL